MSLTLLLSGLLHYKALKYEKLKIPIPPAPIASDKYYGSRSSVYGIRNKIRGANE